MANRSGRLLSPNELSTFCTQLSLILKSGIAASEGLAIMAQDLQKTEGYPILKVVQDELERGHPLHQALKTAEVFPPYMVDMVEIGFQTGRLDEVLDSLATYYEREQSMQKSIRNAVTYPLVMIAMMLIVISVLVMKVLPIFEQVFRQLGGEMTAWASGALRFGTALGTYSLVLISVAALLVLIFLVVRLFPGGRTMLSRMGTQLFGFKKLTAQIASGRIASALSLTLSSGLDHDQSLEMIGRLIDHPVVHEQVRRCRERVAGGDSFPDALAKSDIFTGVYAHMIAVGFKTGKADLMMRKLADQYEEEIDHRISSIISILEPTLVAALSIVVGMILLSVMLPLMGIMASIG